MGITIGPSIRGDVKIIRRNVLTDEVDLVVEKKNTILKALYENTDKGILANNSTCYGFTILAGGGTTPPRPVAMNRCKIGTSNVTPTINDTNVKGTTLAANTNGTTIGYSDYGSYPIYMTRQWVFEAGTGTGNVGEVFLYSEGIYGAWDNTPIARQVFDPVIEKTEYHELTIQWTITVTATTQEGDIEKGQRDGVTTVHWKSFINYRQLWRLTFSFTNENPAICFGKAIPVITGTGNDDSDLTNDDLNTIKGVQIFSGAPTSSSVYSYKTGSFYRDVRIGFGTGQSNGSIGEILIKGNFNIHGLYRITFTPALDKTSDHQLYLDIRFGYNIQ